MNLVVKKAATPKAALDQAQKDVEELCELQGRPEVGELLAHHIEAGVNEFAHHLCQIRCAEQSALDVFSDQFAARLVVYQCEDCGGNFNLHNSNCN